MGFPAAVRHSAASEKRLGDFAVTCLVEPTVERAQRQGEAFAARGGQFCRVSAYGASGQTMPKADRRRGANLEELVERQDNARGVLAGRFEDVQAEYRAAPLDQPRGPVLDKRRVE